MSNINTDTFEPYRFVEDTEIPLNNSAGLFSENTSQLLVSLFQNLF